MRTAPRRLLLLLVLLCAGLCGASWLVGTRPLDPTDTSWLRGDPLQAYMGWFFLRQQPRLAFPLGFVRAIGFPFGQPVAYLDSDPPVAVLFWLVRDLLPPHFQYAGLSLVLCCALQTWFGYLISRHVAERCMGAAPRWLVEAAACEGALLFLGAPPFMFRFRGHFTLAGQWLVLAAIERFLERRNVAPRRFIAHAAAIAFIAGCVHPYLELMVLMVFAASFTEAAGDVLLAPRRSAPPAPAAWGRPAHALRALAGIVPTVVAGLAALTVFGFVWPGQGLDQYTSGGYGYFSMNLLSPIDSRGYGLLPALPSGRGQFEGYSYFGAGMLSLACCSLLRRRVVRRRWRSWRVACAASLVLVSAALAVSSKAMIGGHVLYDIDLPSFLSVPARSFRASGRLFVPGFYVLFTGILAIGALASGRRFPVVLGLVLIVQLLDLSPLARFSRHRWDAARTPMLASSQVWDTLGRHQRHLVVVPAQECDDGRAFFGTDSYWLFDGPAATQHMSTNSFYSARLSERARRFFCSEQPEALVRHGLADDTAYVFDRTHPPFGVALGDHRCRMVDGVIVCAADGGREGMDPAIVAPEAPVGRPVRFAAGADAAAGPMLGLGWWEAEATGRWSSSSAVLAFRLPGHWSAAIVSIRGIPLATPAHPQDLITDVNGRVVGRWHFATASPADLAFRLRQSDAGADGLIALRIELPGATAPRRILAGNHDNRVLGFQMISLRVDTLP